MYGQPHWALNRFAGTIQDAPVTGTCNTLQPADGIEAVSIQTHPLPGARFLAPSIPSVMAEASALPEAFARGTDLAAIYPPTAEFPFRTQAYWRMGGPSAHGGASPLLASCELIASTQTDLLDSHPDIFVTTTLPVLQVFRLENLAAGEFAEIAPNRQCHELTPVDGVGCLLYRLATRPFSYAELVHPQDFTSTRLEFQPAGAHSTATARHHLFAHRLEKGVVLRSRVLGLWLHGEDDFQTTTAIYQTFATSNPPLTA